MVKSMWTLPFKVDDKTLEAITSPDADPLLIDMIQTIADMAQPVTPEDAARVLLEYLQNLDESHVWEQAQKAQEALMSESADVVLAALRAIATPPQEKDDG